MTKKYVSDDADSVIAYANSIEEAMQRITANKNGRGIVGDFTVSEVLEITEDDAANIAKGIVSIKYNASVS